MRGSVYGGARELCEGGSGAEERVGDGAISEREGSGGGVGGQVGEAVVDSSGSASSKVAMVSAV